MVRGKSEEKAHPFMVILSPATSVVLLDVIVGPEWKIGAVNENQKIFYIMLLG